MPSKNLTPNMIDKLTRPIRGTKEVSDITKGLFLYVTSAGAKNWFTVYRVAGQGAGGLAGRRVKLKIGVWPVMSVAEARAEATRITALAASGIDPKEESQRQQEAEELDRLGTVGAVAGAWLQAMEAGQITGSRKRPVSRNTYRNRETVLRLHITPRLGGFAMNDVTPAVLGRMLQDIERTGGPVDGALKTIKALWTFAKSRGLAHGEAPSADLKPRQAKQHEARALSDDELRSIWWGAEQLGYPFGPAIQLLMLTGQRKSEIADAQWSWFNADRGTLTIPQAMVKNRKGSHEVVLAQKGIDILTDVARYHEALHPNSPYIFTSAAGKTPISGWSKVLVRLEDIRKELGDAPQPWRLHELRHTFITRARDGDENADGEVVWAPALDVIQATVNHALSVGVTGVYDHGDMARRYRIQKRELAEWWAAKLMTVVGA